MKVIIAGSRTITSRAQVFAAIAHAQADGLSITEMVSGRAMGVDRLGEIWAAGHGVPMTPFPVTDEARKRDGAGRAPLLRNNAMGDYADALIAVWDGESTGTPHMLTAARQRGLVVYAYLAGADRLRCIERPRRQEATA